ncbi:MAG: DUF6812 domain-containing protein [Candidatus Limnocylindria bacterium]
MRTTTAPVRGVPDAQDLQPIRLYLAEMVLVASVSPGGERMTDILNNGGELAVLPHGAEGFQAQDWMSVQIDDLEMVVPPRHVSQPEKRIERDHYEVRLRIGEWQLAGTAHLKPGAEQDALLLSTHPFLPLTDVTMSSPNSPRPETHEVVIVNLRHAEFVVD